MESVMGLQLVLLASKPKEVLATGVKTSKLLNSDIRDHVSYTEIHETCFSSFLTNEAIANTEK